MASTLLKRCTTKDKIQHHLLNWIVIFRYRMVRHGISKNTTLKYLGNLENILKKLNIIVWAADKPQAAFIKAKQPF